MKYTRFHTTRLRAAAWLTVLAMVAALIPMGLWLIKATDFAGYDSAYGIEEGQDGSLADPYFISTAEELQNIGRAGGPAGNATDLTKHYALKADIDLFDLGAYYAFTPIAPGGDTADCFSGSLDGDNGAGGCYKISNLLIPMGSGSNNYGLFGNIGGDAVISNLEIETALNSSGYGVFSNDSGKAGVLAGYTNGANDGGSIANVTTRGVVHSGFAAGASGARAGGLVGASDGMTITDCVNYADIWVGYVDSRGGGIAGDAGSSDISGCTNYGSVFGGTIAGGIAGSATAEIRYENLTNYGHVRSGNQPNPVAGGIAGAGDGAEFYRCFNYGELTTGSSGVSGTFGAANGMGGITNYRFIREFDDPKHAVITVTECLSACKVTGTTNTRYGGLVGTYVGIPDNGNGTPAATNPTPQVIVDKCVVLNNITAMGAFSGLVIGNAQGGLSTISNTYVGGINATTGIGGGGETYNGNTTTTAMQINPTPQYTTITNCYTSIHNSSGTQLRRIYGIGVLSHATSLGGATATEAAMMNEATFATFDFDETWGIYEGTSLPYLLWTEEAGFDPEPATAWTYTDGALYTTDTPVGPGGVIISDATAVNLKATLINGEVASFPGFAMTDAEDPYTAPTLKQYSLGGIIYPASDYPGDFTRYEIAYGIELDKTGTEALTAATWGYTTAPSESVTITNTGNQPTGVLTVALVDDDDNAFALSAGTVASIAVGSDAAFTVSAVTGLAPGTYTATVEVSGENVVTQTFDVSFTVEKVKINSVDLAITAPVAGNTPQTTVSGTGYEAAIVWDPAITAGGTFAPETVYTATVTLTTLTNPKHIFVNVPTAFTATINEDYDADSIVFVGGDEVVAEFAFPQTALVVIGLEVKTQPDELTYTSGDALDLTGLVVTLFYAGGTAAGVDVAAYTDGTTDYSDLDIMFDPDHGDTLLRANNGEPITVSITVGAETYTDTTDDLTVNLRPADEDFPDDADVEDVLEVVGSPTKTSITIKCAIAADFTGTLEFIAFEDDGEGGLTPVGTSWSPAAADGSCTFDGLKPGTTYKFWVRVAAKDAEYAPGENFGPLEVETDIDLLPTESPTDVPTPTGTNTTGTPDTPTPTGTNTTGTPDTPTPTGNTDTPDSPTPTEDKPTKLGDANCDGFVNIDDILFVRDEIFGANKITAIGRLNLLMGPDDRCSIDHILAIRDVIFGGEFKI